MSNSSLCIKLHLPEDAGISSLKKKVFQEELRKINKKYPMEANQINISKIYILDNKNTLEVGLFIRSTVKTDIALEELHLGLENKDKEIIVSQRFNFKEFGTIPSYSGIPLILKFNTGDNYQFDNIEDYSIKFLNIEELQGFSSVNAEIEDLPTNLSFEEEKELLDFLYNLKTLKADEVTFSIFKLSQESSGNIVAHILVRNGYKKEAKVEKLPLTILDESKNVIATNVFSNTDGIVKVNPHKVKLLKLTIESSNILVNDYDLSKCTGLFQ